MNRYFLTIPAEHKRMVKEQIAVLHHQRMGVVAPLLSLLGLIFLVLDWAMIQQEGPSALLWAYLFLDIGFFVFHVLMTLWLLRSPRPPANFIVYGYLALVLLWAVATGNIEFHRSGNYTSIFLTVLGISALGLFSVRGISALLLVTSGVYLGIAALWPSHFVPGLDKYAGLIALPFLAFGVSRTLYAAVVRNLIARHELAEANAALKEVRLSLLRQEKLASLGVLSAGIAHEINNPLAFIRSNVGALERNLTQLSGPEAVVQENRVILEETREGFRRIGEVIQALGTFARDLPPGEFAPYQLNEGVRTTLVMVRREASPDVSLDTDLAELPEVPARGSEVNQVLLNVVMNAVQAVRTLPEGLVRLVLIRTRLEPAFVVAEVVNTGPLIPPGLREKIFEPFFSTKAPGSGMGLGLSLGWQIIVTRHGGEFELLEGDPVTFRIRLPRFRKPS